MWASLGPHILPFPPLSDRLNELNRVQVLWGLAAGALHKIIGYRQPAGGELPVSFFKIQFEYAFRCPNYPLKAIAP